VQLGFPQQWVAVKKQVREREDEPQQVKAVLKGDGSLSDWRAEAPLCILAAAIRPPILAQALDR
jgi:hypothetical protein